LGNANPNESCATDVDTASLRHNEGALRYNKKTKTLEFCNGTNWTATQSAASGLTILHQTYDRNHVNQGMIAEGTFVSSDGAVGGVLSCGGGTSEQRL